MTIPKLIAKSGFDCAIHVYSWRAPPSADHSNRKSLVAVFEAFVAIRSLAGLGRSTLDSRFGGIRLQMGDSGMYPLLVHFPLAREPNQAS